jgi:FkbM family methyltransferase
MQSSKYSSFLNTKGREVKSEFITLEKYLKENSITKIDVLKMDIEGMEFEVLSSR